MTERAKRSIYYFSGTGNSLALARDIADRTNADPIPIASVVDRERIEVETDWLGLVFPLYIGFNGGVPAIVERFFDKLEGVEGRYVFALVSFGIFKGGVIGELGRMLRSRGVKLAAGFMRRIAKNHYSELAGMKGEEARPFSEIMPMMDRRFAVSARCEQCLACLQWCPREAILPGGSSVSGKRYHHPDVSLNQVIEARG
jgi:flavodoxin